MKEKQKNIFIFILLFFATIIIVGSLYYYFNYKSNDFEELLFYLLNGVEKGSLEVFFTALKSCLFFIIILFLLLYIPTTNFKHKFIVKFKKKSITVYPIKCIFKHRFTYAFTLFILSLLIFIYSFKIHTFFIHKMRSSNLYENYYIEGENTNIIFPEEKRNLIIIMLESVETTLCSKKSNGGWDYSIIPELENLANNNINFSNTDLLGGARQTYGTNFTAGSMVAQTAGIPLITPIDMNTSYTGNTAFLSSAFTLGDILKNAGYNLEIMMGSDGYFGGRTQYFTTNGNYKIFDFNYAIEIGKMSAEDKVWWGFEDDKLFDWSKEEILNLANSDKPFNYIMLTADTHFTDGYLSKNAKETFSTQYENVFAYSSKLVFDFISWLQEQDFYDKTTIVIIGDHLGKQDLFYETHVEKDYDRRIYNAFINTAIQPINQKNREFTTLDLYPTILASIGVSIEGERLGLGTNLFSSVPTLSEEFSFDYLNTELKKTSTFYNSVILGRDYYKFKQSKQQ